jgi:hypothetical protein
MKSLIERIEKMNVIHRATHLQFEAVKNATLNWNIIICILFA